MTQGSEVEQLKSAGKYALRRAEVSDVPSLHRLLSFYATQGIVLERSEADLHFYLKNFTVAVEFATGEVVGCVAVRDFGNDLLEVRSLVVREDLKQQGIGRQLILQAKRQLKQERGSYRLFALTLSPGFFEKLGFSIVAKELFPQKIWHDCDQCPKREHCDEVAVLLMEDGVAAKPNEATC